MVVKKKKTKIKVPQAKVYIKSTFNNTLITITDQEGNAIASGSAGASGFKGTRKSTPYAAQIATQRIVDKAKEQGVEKVDVFVKGIGSGRDAAIRSLQAAGFYVNSIKDMTPVPHNGCRPKKPRRV